MTGYASGTLNHIETGNIVPDDRMKTRLIEVFGINPKWLETGEGEFSSKYCRNPEKIGERIGQLRRERGMTLAEFAELTGCPLSTLSRLEKGINNLTGLTADLIADNCGVSAEWLLYGDEDSKYYPCNEKMIAFLKSNPEARKLVAEMMD